MPSHCQTSTPGHSPARRDIESRADCEALVRAFYGRAISDPVIGWLFTDVAKLDLEPHIPRMASFWETVLLDAHSYGGGAFQPHIELNAKTSLKRGHFDRWLHLWEQTVDELFAGERAGRAKHHATRVAAAFQSRLRAIERPSSTVAPDATRDRSASAASSAAAGVPHELLLVHQYRRS